MVDLPDELLIELTPPLTFNGKSLDCICLREPTVGQIEQAQKQVGGALTESNTLKFLQAMIVLIANQPLTFVSQMRITDIWKASDYLMGFIKPDPMTKTDETPLPI